MKHRLSVKRVAVYTVFLGLPVFAVFAGTMLPRFLKVETYRAEILAQLQAASGRRVTIGALHSELFPPSISAEKIAVLEMAPPYRSILSAERVRLHLRALPLLHGEIQIRTAAIERPLLILYTDRLVYGPSLKPAHSESNMRPSLQVLIHQGRIELGGSLFGQNIRWTIDNVEARVDGGLRRIRLSARPTFLGPAARLQATMDPGDETPVHADLQMANLNSLFSILGSTPAAVWHDSMLDAQADAQWPVMRQINLRVGRWTLPAVSGAYGRGTLQISSASVRGKFQFEGLTSSMTLTGQFSPRRTGWTSTARIENYSPEITRLFLRNRWIDSLNGPGSVQVSASRQGTDPIHLSLTGSGFTFAGTRMDVSSWTASKDSTQIVVHVEARTTGGEGQVRVDWTNITPEPSGEVDVAVSSITVGDVFDAFALHPSTPIGIERWSIQKGRCLGTVSPDGRVVFENAALSLDRLSLETSGEIDFNPASPKARLKGHATQVQLEPVLESLGGRPAPVLGQANGTFDLRFSADKRWLESLNGRIEAQSQDGFIRAGKVIYKIAGFLNLTNLVKPSQWVTAKEPGMPYESASGTATLTDGVLKSHDIKILTKNMDVSAKGWVNLPQQTIDARLELQFLNFMKDSLNAIPLVKRVLTPDTGFLQIPLRLRGKLRNPEIE